MRIVVVRVVPVDDRRMIVRVVRVWVVRVWVMRVRVVWMVRVVRMVRMVIVRIVRVVRMVRVRVVAVGLGEKEEQLMQERCLLARRRCTEKI